MGIIEKSDHSIRLKPLALQLQRYLLRASESFTPRSGVQVSWVSSAAPLKPFNATAFQAGKDFFDVTEQDLAGKWAVFFFYPADFTFVCPTELEDLGEHYDDAAEARRRSLSPSRPTRISATRPGTTPPRRSASSTFPFLGDQNHALANNFGVLREGQGLADRATFVVDPDGVIQLVEITSEGVGRNANELVRKIKAAQYVRANPGQVCPAAWEEGEETLAPSLDLVGKI